MSAYGAAGGGPAGLQRTSCPPPPPPPPDFMFTRECAVPWLLGYTKVNFEFVANRNVRVLTHRTTPSGGTGTECQNEEGQSQGPCY